LNAYLAGVDPQAAVHSLADVIDFNRRHASNVMPFFGQERLERAEAKGPLTSEEYLQALETCRRLSRTEGLDKVLAEHRLDALVAPSGGPAWLIDHVNGDSFMPAGGGDTSAAAVAGYPHITVPAGQVCGLPVGVSFMGGPYAEPKLLRLAYAFEQAAPARQAPRFLPTAEV
jgi:amidase